MHSPGTNPRTARVGPIGSNKLISLVIGATALIGGLGAFAPHAYAVIPTGGVPSPMFGVQKFTQPMPRFDVLPRNPVATLNPPPAEQSNQTQQACDPALGGGFDDRTDRGADVDGVVEFGAGEALR